uniref:Variant surface glycoprotein 1125.4341 n=1 Tax=Trypanosoma brucei TaxID=5691 RepID=A0A1J0RAB0_9TRYP|nr:variant surface glycoprotein 1125.4341 [Trypanosoma brucei]
MSFKSPKWVFFAILAITITAVAPVVAFHDLTTTPKTPCNTAARLERFISKTRSDVERQRTAITEANVKLMKFLVASASGAAERRALYMPVVAAAASAIADAQTKLDSAAAKAFKTIQDLSELKGTQELIAEIEDMQLTGITSAAPNAGNNINGAGQLLIKAFNQDKTKCHADNNPTQPTQTAINQIHGHAPVAVATIQQVTRSSTVTDGPRLCCGGTPGSAPTNNCGGVLTTACNTALAISAGKLLQTQIRNWGVTSASNLDYTSNDHKDKTELPSKFYVEDKIKKLKEIENKIRKLTFTADALKDGSLINTQAFEAALLAQINPAAKFSDKDKYSSQLENAKKNIYGSVDNSFDKKIWTTLNGITLDAAATQSEKGEKLENINDLDKLGSALSYYMAKKEPASTPTKECVSQKETTDCGGITDETECNAKDGCKYNKKDSRCENDPAKSTTSAAENDAKPTNTTTSHSFVIHKAPLWLAIFLF